ncbi:MAG: hypothetical protein ACKO37_02065 [Vampirovibrionales bacterium]
MMHADMNVPLSTTTHTSSHRDDHAVEVSEVAVAPVRVLLTVLLSTGQAPCSFTAHGGWSEWIQSWSALESHPLLDQLMVVDPCNEEFRLKTFKSMGIVPWCFPPSETMTHAKQWAWVLTRLLNPSADTHHWIVLLKEGEVLEEGMLAWIKSYLAHLPLHVSRVDMPFVYRGRWAAPHRQAQDTPHPPLHESPLQWASSRCIRLAHLTQVSPWLNHSLWFDTLGETATRQSYETLCDDWATTSKSLSVDTTDCEGLTPQGAIKPWSYHAFETREAASRCLYGHTHSERAVWVAELLKQLPLQAPKPSLDLHLKQALRHIKEYTGIPQDALSENPLKLMTRFTDKERYFWLQLLEHQRTQVYYHVLDYLLTPLDS